MPLRHSGAMPWQRSSRPRSLPRKTGMSFIRCTRGSERELMIALSTVTGCRDVRLALRMVAVSGTMESLRARIRKQKRLCHRT